MTARKYTQWLFALDPLSKRGAVLNTSTKDFICISSREWSHSVGATGECLYDRQSPEKTSIDAT